MLLRSYHGTLRVPLIRLSQGSDPLVIRLKSQPTLICKQYFAPLTDWPPSVVLDICAPLHFVLKTEKWGSLGSVTPYSVLVEFYWHSSSGNPNTPGALDLRTHPCYALEPISQGREDHEAVVACCCGAFSTLPASSFLLASLPVTFHHTKNHGFWDTERISHSGITPARASQCHCSWHFHSSKFIHF